MSDIEIRVCKTWDECLACEELQKRVWEMPDYRDVVPAHLLSTAIKNGGILVGAFDAAEMIGFAFGFLGSEIFDHTFRTKHTSHMLAVLPAARTRGLGAKMKWLQRAHARQQGLALMTWTYDPLQAINAQLNLARLGGIARRYYRNCYGDMTDALNAGVASDRFEVEWHLDSARVSARENAPLPPNKYPDAASVYSIAWDADAFAHIVDASPLAAETLLVEIPADYNAMKRMNRELAIVWRARTRDTFERAFGQGYVCCDLVRSTDSANRPRSGYILKRNFDFLI